MSAAAAVPLDESLADLVDRLGGVPLERIRLHPAPGTASEEDVLTALALPRKRICELIDGVLVEKGMGYTESLLANYVIEMLNGWVRRHNLGHVTGPDGTIRLWPGRVRIPDIAFFSWARLPGRRRPAERMPPVAPDLAVEVLSESNTAAEMLGKRRDYFRVGVRLVWEIDPERRTVAVYQDPVTPPTVLDENGTLEGGEMLPGFTLSLRELFQELDRQG